jgi:hypothetical protein
METTTKKFECTFCHKEFARENSLAVHVCEQKRRFQERDERGVQLGLQAYLRFYETQQGSSRLKTFADFAESAYYRAFVKFGRYCVNTRVISPGRFMDWLLKNSKKIDHWCSDQLYTEYLIEYLRLEHVDDALARAMEYGISWSERNGHPAEDCLRYGSTNGTCHAIVSGRVSAWIIYNCESGQRFLEGISSEQVAMIWPYIDADPWQKKFQDYPADQEYMKEMLNKAGW